MNETITTLLYAPWKIAVIFTAIRLRLFTFLSGGPMTIEELSLKCKARPHLMGPLINACISMDMVKRSDNKYINSHFSQVYFVEGNSQYIGDFVCMQYNEFDKWYKLYDLINKDRQSKGDILSLEENHRTFIKGMHNIGNLGEAEALKNAVDLSGCKVMVDAGGGSGLYSIVLCQNNPELKSIILDMKKTLDITKEIISSYNMNERITLQEADITKSSFGQNIDVVLLSDVIYDEITALPVLHNAWDSLRAKGKLILRGYYSDPGGTDPLFGALFALNQLVFDPNRKLMTLSLLEKTITDTGFYVIKKAALTERSSLLIAEKG